MIDNREVASYSSATAIDEGLREYMLKIYNYMAGGLGVTGLVSYLIANNISILKLFIAPTGYTALGWVALLAPLLMIFFFGKTVSRGSLAQVQAMFWGFSVLMSVSLAPIFIAYTGASITRVFLITAATFGAFSLYGYTTKKDISGWGSFLTIGLIGLIIASVVNFFMQSAGFYYAISYIGVFIFAGLTAYDTQSLKSLYYKGSFDEELTGKLAISGALSLYLDFINMFIYLLRIMGDRR